MTDHPHSPAAASDVPDDAPLRRQALDATERLRTLSEASRAFAAAPLDLPSVLEAVARYVQVGVGDACALMLVTADGKHLVPEVTRHRDPEAQRAIAETLAAAPVRVGENLPGRVAQTGEPVRIPVVPLEVLAAATRPEYRDHLTRFPIHSLLIVPIQVAGRVLGVMTVARTTPDRPYTPEDESLLQDLADRAALALGHARAYEAERAAVERLTRLHALTGALAAAMTPRDVAALAVVEGCEALGATSGMLYESAPDGSLRLVAQRGVPEAFLAGLREIALDSLLLAAQIARTRAPVWVESFEQYRAAWPELAARVAEANRARAFAALPLVADGHCFGVLVFAYEGDHAFPQADRAFVSMLAHHSAQALYRSRILARAEAATRQAEEASRLKDEFLATVSHELRTPLSAILGWASMLAARAEPASAHGLAVIERNARSQVRIVDDILDVSRIVRGELRLDPEVVDVAAVGGEVVESFLPAARAQQVALTFDGGDGPCRLVADPERVRQILWNLVSNALKFTPAGGRASLSVTPAAGSVVITVRDTGRGIDPSFLPYVFDRFRQGDGTTTRASGGLGLGLAIVRHLAEMHGGTASAASDGAGRGATFVVTLPVSPFTRAVRDDREAANTPAGALAGLRVLVVDDEDDARELVALFLSSAGALVQTAGSAASALEAVDSFDPDVLLSDVGMPHRDGYWLVAQVRQRRPDLPAVALTAFARREDADRARAAGFDAHVGKPAEPGRLVEAVAAARRAKSAA